MSNPFGFGGTPASVAATAGSGASSNNLDGTNAAVYYWTTPKTKVIVWNHPTTGPALLYGLWNDIASAPTTGTATTAANKYDFVIEPGGYATNPDGLPIKSVGLFAASAETYNTDFVVRGF